MEFLGFAFPNPFAPLVAIVQVFVAWINGFTHNYGWSMILLAAAVKLALWPLNTMQYKSISAMQTIAPRLKALRERYKSDPERLNKETMQIYKDSGVNPMASCLPLLVQLPIIYSLFQAIQADIPRFGNTNWLWIGSGLSQTVPYHILASSLAKPDYLLLLLYVISMYFSIRFSTPAVDPEAAQQQKIMAFLSPAMIGFFGFKYAWPSALYIYWLTFNVFQIAQQFYLIEKYHRNPAPVGPHPENEVAVELPPATPVASSARRNGSGPGQGRARRKRRSRR